MIVDIIQAIPDFIVSCMEHAVFLVVLLKTINIIKVSRENPVYKPYTSMIVRSVICNNCLSFWCITGMIIMLEYLSFGILNVYITYRIIRLLGVICIQVNNFEATHNLISIVGTLVKEHEKLLQSIMNKTDEMISKMYIIHDNLRQISFMLMQYVNEAIWIIFYTIMITKVSVCNSLDSIEIEKERINDSF